MPHCVGDLGDLIRFVIGVHGEAQDTAGGVLGVRKAALAESILFTKRREDRLQVERNGIMHCCRYTGRAHG